MKLHHQKEDIDVNKTLIIEATIEELTVLFALIGESSTSSTREAILESRKLTEQIKAKVRPDVGNNLYQDMFDLLSTEGVVKEV